MKLPNGGQAFVDDRKVIEYCLSEEHDEGKHKAHLFRRLVGIGVGNAELLLDALLDAAAGEDAARGKLDHYGQRYTIDFVLHGPGGAATVRSAWIVRTSEQFPRLVSCFIL